MGTANINGAPEAVGFSLAYDNGNYDINEPVSWSANGTATNLLPRIPGGTPGSAWGFATGCGGGDVANAIDASGDIVGSVVAGGVASAFYVPGGGGMGTVLPYLNPSSQWATATGVSNAGLVVGYSTATDSNSHAFVWSASGGMIDLGASGVSSVAYGISPNGNTIVGTTTGGFGTDTIACEWTRSGSTWTMSPLVQQSQYAQSYAYAVNNSGVVVGGAYDYPLGGSPNPSSIALEYQPGGNIVRIGQIGSDLGSYYAYGINDSGVIAGGQLNWSGGFVNYTGQPGANVDLYGSLPSAVAAANTAMDAYALDDNGDIAGLVDNPLTLAYAGYFLSPAIPGDANTDGRVDINDLTVVLAHYGQTGMTWTQGEFTGDGTVDINDLTIVLAHYNQTFGTANGAVAAVPEPASITLIGACAAAVLASSWRRRRRSP
jgi:probable HAF family extracellular repeat protein